MRLAYIANGKSLHVKRWLNYFADHGWEIHLICWKADDTGYHKNIHVHKLFSPFPTRLSLFQYANFLIWIIHARFIVKKIKPHVLDSQEVGIYGFLAATCGFHPLIVNSMGSDLLINYKRNILFKKMITFAVRTADLVLCNSNTVTTRLLEIGINSDKIRKILNGIDLDEFRPIVRNGNRSATRSVISIRNLKPVYNVEMFIRAIPKILRQCPDTRFTVGGEGELRVDLETLADSQGITDKVVFTGWIPHDKLHEYLSSADIYVSTSLSDSASVSLQEALACELAPVVTDIPANREWIEDGVNGYLIPIDDVDLMAEKIIYLLQNPDMLVKFGQAGRKMIRERANYSTEMGRMDDIYKELIRNFSRS